MCKAQMVVLFEAATIVLNTDPENTLAVDQGWCVSSVAWKCNVGENGVSKCCVAPFVGGTLCRRKCVVIVEATKDFAAVRGMVSYCTVKKTKRPPEALQWKTRIDVLP